MVKSEFMKWKKDSDKKFKVPFFKVRPFASIMTGKDRAIKESALTMLCNVGLLSESVYGNYSPRAKLFPDFPIGMRLGDKGFYFTIREDCLDYAKKVIPPNAATVKENGYYQIPEKIEIQDWAVIRAKCVRRDTSYKVIPEELMKRNILSKTKRFSVVSGPRSPEKSIYYNLEEEPNSVRPVLLYFVEYKTALDFSKSIGVDSLRAV
ncbi:MAG: hypothetical protein Q7S74_06810 [Nanoarchaeota archaeon]|nr:hypothetical protein [Nanoarchaeota archaeon]